MLLCFDGSRDEIRRFGSSLMLTSQLLRGRLRTVLFSLKSVPCGREGAHLMFNSGEISVLQPASRRPIGTHYDSIRVSKVLRFARPR